jgi:hypothetical protein
MKMAVFWDVAPCSLVDVDWCFRGAYCLHHQGRECWRWRQHLWNIAQFLPDYTAQYPSRLHARRRDNLKSHTKVSFVELFFTVSCFFSFVTAHSFLLEVRRRGLYSVEERFQKPQMFRYHSCTAVPRSFALRVSVREPGRSVSIVSDYGLQCWACVVLVCPDNLHQWIVRPDDLYDLAIEDLSLAEAKGFFLYRLRPDRSWGPPSLLYNGYRGPFPGVKRGLGVTLTTHPHLVPRSRMIRSYTSSPPWCCMACTGQLLSQLILKSW